MIKGQNLRLALNNGTGDVAYLAAAKDCNLHGSADIEDTTTKDTPTGEKEQECTGKNYDMSTNSLVVSATEAKKWLDAVGATVSYSYDLTTGDNNDEKSTEIRSGKAIINDVSLQASDRQNATLAIQLTETYVKPQQ